MSPADAQALNSVDVAGWKKEVADVAAYYAKFDGRLPEALAKQLEILKQRLA